jgi:AcrR family transcriptional regulator
MSALPSRRHDLLTEVLLTPTTGPELLATALRGGRALPEDGTSRPADPKSRSRAAVLIGAARAVLLSGTQISVAQVAAAAGMAKSVVQRQFTSADQILTALMVAEIDRVSAQLAGADLSEALAQAAMEISENPLLEAIGAEDSAVLAMLSRVDVRSAGWSRVAAAVDELLWRSGRTGTPIVLRWLGSFVTAPAEEADIYADVDVLVAGLPPRTSHATSAALR